MGSISENVLLAMIGLISDLLTGGMGGPGGGGGIGGGGSPLGGLGSLGGMS